MRLIIAFTIIAGCVGLGGCFHHNSAVMTEPLPPVASPPLK